MIFESPASNVGPWPAIRGCTTSSYSSISPNLVRHPAEEQGVGVGEVLGVVSA